MNVKARWLHGFEKVPRSKLERELGRYWSDHVTRNDGLNLPMKTKLFVSLSGATLIALVIVLLNLIIG